MTNRGNAVAVLLLDRRAKLEAAARSRADRYLHELLEEVDAALGKIDVGTFGLCETCGDPIEADRLRADPLVRFCLDHLDDKERTAHERDLALATEIQSKLLPPADLTVGPWETHYCYEAAGPVGGDYCELIEGEGGGSLFFAVGDVAGKGVAASLLMTHLNAIFRSLLSLQLPLSEVMSRANRLFCEGTLAAHYATMVCGRATGSDVELCNTGRCPPLVTKLGRVERLDFARLPLGMFCTTDYPVERISLGMGESLVLYSDGVTEATDGEGDEFGEARLTDCIRERGADSVRGLARGILGTVGEHRGSAPVTDDLTVLVVRRRITPEFHPAARA